MSKIFKIIFFHVRKNSKFKFSTRNGLIFFKCKFISFKREIINNFMYLALFENFQLFCKKFLKSKVNLNYQQLRRLLDYSTRLFPLLNLNFIIFTIFEYFRTFLKFLDNFILKFLMSNYFVPKRIIDNFSMFEIKFRDFDYVQIFSNMELISRKC